MKEYLNTILCADCVAATTLFDTESIDLVVTSPPYDTLRSYDSYEFDYKPLAEQMHRILKKGGVAVWIVGDEVIRGSETGNSFRQALYFRHLGFNLHDTMIYQKNTSAFPDSRTGTRYTQTFEYMFMLAKGQRKARNAQFNLR